MPESGPEMSKSWIQSAIYRELSAALLLSGLEVWTVLQYHLQSMTAISTTLRIWLRLAWSREIDLKVFLEGCRSSQLFWSPDHSSNNSYLIIHPDQATKLSKAWAVSLFTGIWFLYQYSVVNLIQKRVLFSAEIKKKPLPTNIVHFPSHFLTQIWKFEQWCVVPHWLSAFITFHINSWLIYDINQSVIL